MNEVKQNTPITGRTRVRPLVTKFRVVGKAPAVGEAQRKKENKEIRRKWSEARKNPSRLAMWKMEQSVVVRSWRDA